MISSGRAPLVLLAAVSIAACASPLRRPPPSLAEMAGTSDASSAAGRKAFDDALEMWTSRPDRDAVQSAADAFLRVAAGAESDELAVESLIGAARALAWLAEHEDDAERRRAHAQRAVQAGQHCSERAPDHPPCEYWLGIGLGLDARERPGAALSSLSRMIELLDRVASASPAIDHGGAHRVLALVYLRAPGWPLGPGDADAGLAHAQRAVEIDGTHPPNLLVAAEALSRHSRDEESRAMYRRALAAARELTARGDPDGPEWERDAEQALRDASGV